MAHLDDWVYPLLAAALIGALAVGLFLRARRRRTVFVSYRHSDAADETDEIVAALVRRFGRAQVFHDVHSIVPGEAFRTAIDRTLRRCDAAVVVIGPRWATATADGAARPRLFEADDMVCAEVARSLDAGVRVLPLLVRGAPLPAATELPAVLARLPEHQALAWRGAGDADTVARLCAAVAAAPMRHTPLFLVLCQAGALLVLALFAWAGGLTPDEFGTSAGIALPGLATSLAALAARRWHPALTAARSAWIGVGALAVPLAFLATLTLLVVVRSFNLGGLSFEGFKLALVVVEVVWAAYIGVALAGMFANTALPSPSGRRPPGEGLPG